MKQGHLKRNASRAQSSLLSSTRPLVLSVQTVFQCGSKSTGCPQGKKRLPRSRNRKRQRLFWRNLSLIPALPLNTKRNPARRHTAMPEDVLRCRSRTGFTSSDAYTPPSSRFFYEATGHSSRVNRQTEPETLKSRAFEENAGGTCLPCWPAAKFHLPMPDNSASAQVANWNRKFSGGDVAELVQGALTRQKR